MECDWWSVGAIAYEMMVGFPPFYSGGQARAASSSAGRGRVTPRVQSPVAANAIKYRQTGDCTY